MNKEQPYFPSNSFIRVATACPEVSLADVPANIDRIAEIYESAEEQEVSLVVFPELSLTGYTLGDLVQQSALLSQAENGLQELANITLERHAAMVVGLPIKVTNGLYNCAAVLADGAIKGIVPKSNLPTYNEFYEGRWYQTWNQANTTIEIGGQTIPFGTELLFDIADTKCGIEICEDLWVSQPPSVKLAEAGAQIIVNPSASPEQVGKANYRRDLVRLQSSRLISGYIYAGCDVSESTSEIVMGGHQLIASNGNLVNESLPFNDQKMMIAEIDTDHLEFDRRKQHMATVLGPLVIKTEITRQQNDVLLKIERNPFLPNETTEERSERLQMALRIQAHGLAMRMRASHQESLVLGLSGGLDSTLALLVALETADILGKESSDMIHTLTMPGLASSEQTQDNAQALAAALGVPNTVIPIHELAEMELAALGHNGHDQDITYENVQARARTSLLFNYANKHHAMVLGTGDLSEIALGWCTYNADQQSHYNVNASVPKTLVRHLVTYLAEQPRYKTAKVTLEAILETPVSPELTTTNSENISQTTEDIIGPYELHDFFLYHLVRWGDKPAKIAYLAERVFADSYTQKEVNHWFGVFIKRFVQNQFKRETLPNGPKIGSVSLSPRGDWRMPPDLYNSALWK